MGTQIHFQDKRNNKYLYDPKKKKFFSKSSQTGKYDKPAPNWVNSLMNNKSFRDAIKKGNKYLGNEQ